LLPATRYGCIRSVHCGLLYVTWLAFFCVDYNSPAILRCCSRWIVLPCGWIAARCGLFCLGAAGLRFIYRYLDSVHLLLYSLVPFCSPCGYLFSWVTVTCLPLYALCDCSVPVAVLQILFVTLRVRVAFCSGLLRCWFVQFTTFTEFPVTPRWITTGFSCVVYRHLRSRFVTLPCCGFNAPRTRFALPFVLPFACPAVRAYVPVYHLLWQLRVLLRVTVVCRSPFCYHDYRYVRYVGLVPFAVDFDFLPLPSRCLVVLPCVTVCVAVVTFTVVVRSWCRLVRRFHCSMICYSLPFLLLFSVDAGGRTVALLPLPRRSLLVF